MTKHCPEGKVLNPKTGRCIKDPKTKTKIKKEVKKKECPDGKIRNPQTGRCIKDPKSNSKEKVEKKCPDYKVLNPLTGRCVNKKPSPKPQIPQKILTEADCPPNTKLNPKTNRCIQISYEDRVELGSNYKAYFTIKDENIDVVKKLGAKWDSSKRKWYYTIDTPLSVVFKLNSLSNEKPKRIYLEKDSIKYFYKDPPMFFGARWDPAKKLWYYFDNLPEYNKDMLENTDWKYFHYRYTFEIMR